MSELDTSPRRKARCRGSRAGISGSVLETFEERAGAARAATGALRRDRGQRLLHAPKLGDLHVDSRQLSHRSLTTVGAGAVGDEYDRDKLGAHPLRAI